MLGYNPIVGSFFNRNPGSYTPLPPKIEEIQDNIAKLDSIIRASPLPISFQTKMKLFRKYSRKTFMDQEAKAILKALEDGPES